MRKFEESIKSKKEVKSEEEDETLKDKDSIEYYNRKYAKKEEEDLLIPGSFYKVRMQGGASSQDQD